MGGAKRVKQCYFIAENGKLALKGDLADPLVEGEIDVRRGYFDLLDYLQAVQNSGWRLHWDSLDYHIDEAGPDKARITLELHTLSREAGWVGV